MRREFDRVIIIRPCSEAKEAICLLRALFSIRITLYHERKTRKEFPSRQDIVLVSIGDGKCTERAAVWLPHRPSALVIEPDELN